MIFAGYLIFLLFSSALPFAGAVCLKRRPERLFLAGLLLNGLVYYFMCAANLCSAGFWLIFAGNLAFYVPAALKLRREPAAIREFWTPAVKIFYLVLTVGFLAATREHLMQWDEYSHWCTSARLLFRHGTLNCVRGDLLKHASYPPGLPVLYVLVHKCFVGAEFSDFMPRFAARTLLLSAFLVPFGDAPRRRTVLQCLVGMTGMFCIASFLFPGGVWSCESDCAMGVLFATAVYAVMRHDRSCENDLFLALLLAWLFLVKKAGMGFAVMTLVLYAVRWIADLFAKDRPRRPVWSALVVLAAPFAMQLSWSLLLKLHNTPIIFPVGSISFGGILRLVRFGEPAYGGEIARLFMREFWPHLVCFAVALAALGGCLATAGERRPRRWGDLVWFMPLTLAAFAATLFLTYMFIFTEAQARELVSFKRYMNGYMMMPCAVTMMLLCSSVLPDEKRRRNIAGYAAAALALLIVLTVRYRAEYADEGGATRHWPARRALLAARYGKILGAPDMRFVAVTGEGRGIYDHILRGEYEGRFVREIKFDQDPRSGSDDLSPEEFARQIRDASHVLFASPGGEIAQRYAELLEVPPEEVEDFTLFEVTPEGRLRPVR